MTRNYRETTARNLLRKPLVLGVPFEGLLGLSTLTLGAFVAGGSTVIATVSTAALGGVGYAGLRIAAKYLQPGWEETPLWSLECLFAGKGKPASWSVGGALEVHAPDTLDDDALIGVKVALLEHLEGLRSAERATFVLDVTTLGARLHSVRAQAGTNRDWLKAVGGIAKGKPHIYSLCQLPVTTDPLWSFDLLSRIPGSFRVIVSFRGLDGARIKRQVELSRRSSSHTSGLVDLDSEVTFEEASSVLKDLSRGSEKVLEASFVLVAEAPIDLDPGLFCLESNPGLTICSALGLRKRMHRSHLVRLATATDLIPNVLDAREPGTPILTTQRGKPLYFSPSDSRLEALHWLVVGASGSGKSFFTGLVLKRMLEGGEPMSVLFVDHNRSFRRVVKSLGGAYCEPETLSEFERGLDVVLPALDSPGNMAGIELSDLLSTDKKAASAQILGQFEAFLRARRSLHPVYLVLDECWNFMRHEPELVERAFREFRKLNGAAIAITQSLSDFLTDQSGQTIFQNAPIRILLRQGEDVTRYQNILGLNAVELKLLKSLRQKRGQYSECLVKTPYLSRLGRLHPTAAEHELLRTDNLREAFVNQRKEAAL